MFVLAIEGISLLMRQARENLKFTGLKVSRGLFITHILFFDDVVIIGGGSLAKWQPLQMLLQHFCNASGLKISVKKSLVTSLIL